MDEGLWQRTQALNLYTFGQALQNEDSLTQSQGESSLNPGAKEFVPSFKSTKLKDVKEFVPMCKSGTAKEFLPSSKNTEVKEFFPSLNNTEVKEFVPSYKHLEAKEFVPPHPKAKEFLPSYPEAKKFVSSYPEFKDCVPSYKQKSEEKNTASTSTQRLSHGEASGDAKSSQRREGTTDGKISQRDIQDIFIQRQIFEFLTELGDEQMPLDTIVVALLPNGQGLGVNFTTKEYVGGKNLLDEALCRNTCLTLHVNDPDELASKPENVLVNQFLIRVNDQLSEKLEHTNAVVAPKGRMNRNRSYTELEIEQQIEGIKVFDNFFNYTESMRTQERVTQKAFKELFHSLGMIAQRSCATTPVESPRKSSLPFPKATKIDEDEEEVEVDVDVEKVEEVEAEEFFSSCNDSESEGDDITLRGKQLETDLRKYMRDKLYRFEDDNGPQLVNQLSDADLQEMMPNNFEQSGPPSTPAISQTLAYKCPKTTQKCVMHSTLMTPTAAAPRNIPRPNQKQRVSVPSLSQKGRHGVATGSNTSAVTAKKLQPERPAQFIATGVRTKTNQRLAKMGAAGHAQHSSSMAAAAMAVRMVKTSSSGRAATVTQKQQLNLAKSTGTEISSNRGGVTAATKPKNNTQGGSKKMLPRSTNASLMRQQEVKRRLSLMHGDSDPDLLYNEYLFK
ncbi:uncharacterized protein LOC111077740 isoform X2 [Drosophila obscura]|uniref:uncharacterized protein LOC111077740 isoform X2 n=1 Tax=Drosophila obscura TaxID=7282 RepID=UPI001BB19424|nr:uncharacterized protein LOC111077740 isoform X2 [Drosophila obscura]